MTKTKLLKALAKIIDFQTGKEVKDFQKVVDQPKKPKKKDTRWIVKPKNKSAWFMLIKIIPPKESSPGKYSKDANNYLLEEIGEIHQNDVEDMVPLTEDTPFAKLRRKTGWYPIEDITEENVIIIKDLGNFTEDEIEEIAA